MLEVWQNLASFGGRLIGSAVEALLSKVVNPHLSVLLIVVFCSRCCLSENIILSAPPTENIILSALPAKMILPALPTDATC